MTCQSFLPLNFYCEYLTSGLSSFTLYIWISLLWKYKSITMSSFFVVWRENHWETQWYSVMTSVIFSHRSLLMGFRGTFDIGIKPVLQHSLQQPYVFYHLWKNVNFWTEIHYIMPSIVFYYSFVKVYLLEQYIWFLLVKQVKQFLVRRCRLVDNLKVVSFGQLPKIFQYFKVFGIYK